MDVDDFDEAEVLSAIARSGARVLLIGRRALVALGLPVMTGDYDLWVHVDDIDVLNQSLAPHDFVPTYPPAEARARGRYVLEDGAHVDVLVARQQTTKDGEVVRFPDVWERREPIALSGVDLFVPSIDDLILTKRWSMRAKDIQDIQMLENLRRAKT